MKFGVFPKFMIELFHYNNWHQNLRKIRLLKMKLMTKVLLQITILKVASIVKFSFTPFLYAENTPMSFSGEKSCKFFWSDISFLVIGD